MVTLLGCRTERLCAWCRPWVEARGVARTRAGWSPAPGCSQRLSTCRHLGTQGVRRLVVPHLLRWQGNTLKINFTSKILNVEEQLYYLTGGSLSGKYVELKHLILKRIT